MKSVGMRGLQLWMLAVTAVTVIGLAWAGIAALPATGQATAPAQPTQTPIPVSAGIQAPFGYGVAAGDMTTDSAVLWTRMPGEADVVAEISETPGFESPRQLNAHAGESTDYTVKTTATGLQAGTQYWYRFQSGGATSAVGSFETPFAPSQDAKVTMAFTGDAHWSWKPFPLLKSLAEEPLDFFVFLGDLIYESRNLTVDKNGTIAAETLDEFRYKYRENREPRPNGYTGDAPIRDLYAAFGQYSVVDNHETANSKVRGAPPYITGGATFDGEFVNRTEGFKNRIQAYSEYQPVREDLVTGTGDPRLDQTQRMYRAIPWGANADLIVLDDRSYRDEALATATEPAVSDCSRTMLGAPQMKWLQDELTSAQGRNVTWKLIVISSPIAELGKERDGTKAWAAGYVCERNNLLKFIDDRGINNVVFLTTDNHYTMVNNLVYNEVASDQGSTQRQARNAFEIITGPLGADTTDFAAAFKVDPYGLTARELDRRILAAWNDQSSDSARNLYAAPFDPIGLEADFPGLVTSSVRSVDEPDGVVEPAQFATFYSFSYTVLEMDRSSLVVTVKGFPAVFDPALLYDPLQEQLYEQRVASEIMTFEIMAQ
jgi:phosphodiesterase/alkaline phosphatase D-like protein